MSRTMRPMDVFPITTRRLEVLRVEDLTPGMRRVTLGGEQLAAHTADNGMPVAAFRSEGFDDEFKLFLQHPDAEEAVVPTQSDGLVDWPRSDPHLLFRTYTVRRWDPDAGEIDVDFVVHGVGPATSWASRVRPGEPMQIAGPKSSSGHPEGADWTLVAGDETALPAIGRWLENWPDGARGQVFIEVAEASHCQRLPVPDGVELTWLPRDGAQPGTTTLLIDALKAAPWWDGKVFAWVAGEALTLAPIRRWLRQEKGLEKDQLDITGYWRRQEVAISAEDPSMPELDAEDDEERFHELTEITAGFALRAAATIGVAEALRDGPRTAAQLAEATGTEAPALSRLLDVLGSHRLLEAEDDGRIRLTGIGSQLDDEHHLAELSLDGYEAQRELEGLLSLMTALRPDARDGASQDGEDVGPDHSYLPEAADRSASSAYARRTGRSWAEHLRRNPSLLKDRLEDEDAMAFYIAGALAGAVPLEGPAHLVIQGRGPAQLARSLVEVLPQLRVSVRACPSELDILRELHPAHERIALVEGELTQPLSEPADAILLSEVLNELDDRGAARALAAAVGGLRHQGRLLVLAELKGSAFADEHEAQQDLLDHVLTGGGARTHDQCAQLLRAAGVDQLQRLTVGWGWTLYTATATATSDGDGSADFSTGA